MVARPGQQQSGGEVIMDGSAPKRMSATQCQNECRTDVRCKVIIVKDIYYFHSFGNRKHQLRHQSLHLLRTIL